MLEGFGGPFEVRRPFLRLLEACENEDAKLDGEEAKMYAIFGRPDGMRGAPGGTIGRLIKRQRFQAYINRHFNLIRLGDSSLAVRHAVAPTPQRESGGGFKRFAHSAGPGYFRGLRGMELFLFQLSTLNATYSGIDRTTERATYRATYRATVRVTD